MLQVLKKSLKNTLESSTGGNINSWVVDTEAKADQMLENIMNDEYTPSQCAFNSEHISGYWYYDNWDLGHYPQMGPGNFPLPLPHYRHTKGGYARLGSIAQGDGTAYIIDFYKFFTFPDALRTILMDKRVLCFTFNFGTDLSTMERVYGYPMRQDILPDKAKNLVDVEPHETKSFLGMPIVIKMQLRQKVWVKAQKE